MSTSTPDASTSGASTSDARTAARRNPVVRPQSQQDMIRKLQERMPGLHVYSPHDEWLPMDVHGIPRWCPPDLGGKIMPHPVTGQETVCNGILEVRSRFPKDMKTGQPQKDSSGKEISGQDAVSVALFITDEANYGQMGVMLLPGPESSPEDPTTEEVIAAAREKHRRYQESKDEDVVAKRLEFKKNWEKNPAKKGQECPPPTVKEMAALDRIQTRQSSVETYAYNCDIEECAGYASNDWRKFFDHMSLTHGIEPDRSRYDGDVKAVNQKTSRAAGPSGREAEIARRAEAERPQSSRKRGGGRGGGRRK